MPAWVNQNEKTSESLYCPVCRRKVDPPDVISVTISPYEGVYCLCCLAQWIAKHIPKLVLKLEPEKTVESCQPCGCDPGCKPEPHVCEQHRHEQFLQDRTAVSSTLGDTCPRCGTTLEHSEGLERDYPHCPVCVSRLAQTLQQI